MEARELIDFADDQARKRGFTQAEWSRQAGFDDFGKLISNTYKKGNCKVNVLIALLRPLGYELTVVKREDRK